MSTLKKYQENSLDALRQYLKKARSGDAKTAYDEHQYQRYHGNYFKSFQQLKGLEATPYVCLRLPTGGGKTLLAAHSISLAGEIYIESDHPVVLWLVPTNTIKLQTLETLKNPDHRNRIALDNTLDRKVSVFDITEFRHIRPQDMQDNACVIVSTFAALRVDKTEGRKVYEHDENLEPHFCRITANSEGMERDAESGEIKFSFANLLCWHQPLVIIDEAHNAKSDLSIEVLRRVNAACVIEYTATPAKNSNVIYSVSASELKAEEMIKLPIILSQHDLWEQAITSSIQHRKKLEEIALKDKDYIRPIVLFQAENKDQKITTDVLKKYLIENEEIPSDQIAIATGEQRDLDSIDLFNPNCPVRYIITVQALKEGWDCSFAYILCPVANTHSKTAVEQLLGRVLRMPYVKRRAQKELNQAYAFVSSQCWADGAAQLHDRLVSMGFEDQEAEEFIFKQSCLEGIDDQVSQQTFEVILESKPDLSVLSKIEQSAVRVEKNSAGKFTLKIGNSVNKNLIKKLSKSASNTKDKAEILSKGEIYLQTHSNQSPAQSGAVLSIPQLCLNFENEIMLAERELCMEMYGWNLLDYYQPLDKSTFSIEEKSRQYIIDTTGKKITVNFVKKQEQLTLDGIKTEMDDLDLCCWLEKKLQQQDIPAEVLLEYIRRTVRDLLNRDDLNIASLERGKFVLSRVLGEKIRAARDESCKRSYQKCMFENETNVVIEKNSHHFTFDPNNYPANLLYEGPVDFGKHYYARIGIMNAEEAMCAREIDSHPLVKFWVRNLERQPQYAFWLPVATGKFYPDFIAKLEDNRLLVIEYKGAWLDNSDTEKKTLVGKLWAKKSGNLFLVVWKKDSSGRNIYEQINTLLTKKTG